MARPLVFLDIDGVLNSARFLEGSTRGVGVVVGGAFDATAHLDPTCIARLDRLLDATGALVVLSSSWRHAFGVEKTQRSLVARGFRHELAAATPRLAGVGRHAEIRRYVGTSGADRFVVLDDDPDAGTGLARRFVHVRDGLEDAHVDRALAVLARSTASLYEEIAGDVAAVLGDGLRELHVAPAMRAMRQACMGLPVKESCPYCEAVMVVTASEGHDAWSVACPCERTRGALRGS